MRLNPGDHICALYNSEKQLADVVADFLVDGLQKSERCWYLTSGDDPGPIRAALQARDIDTAYVMGCDKLSILSPTTAYIVDGNFDPELTMHAFSDAIEQAFSDGFTGFRAAANMSWILGLENGAERLITYEALLRSLFSSARATGLCLYDRRRMPLAVINGALSTHPIVRTNRDYSANAFYDPAVQSLEEVDTVAVGAKLETLDR